MKRSQTRWLLVVVAVLLWVGIIYPAYYVVHKPLDPANVQALLNVSADLLTWLAMLAVATALGSRLTRRLAYRSLLERIVFSAGLGLGVFSVLTFGLGLVGLLYRWLFWILLVIGGLLLWREFRDLGRALRQTSWPRPRGRWTIFLSLFMAIILGLTLTLALVPPYEWDSLTYHLVGPAQHIQAHRLTVNFDIYYLFFPSFTEMLFTAGMLLKGDVIPRLIHFSYLLLALGALGAFAPRYWERQTGLVAAALFLSIPTAVQIAAWSYVDLTLTFYGFAAVYALLNGLYAPLQSVGHEQATFASEDASSRTDESPPAEASPTGWLVLAGLFGGAAASIKYTGLTSLAILLTILLWALIRRRLTVRRFFTSALLVTGLTLAIVAPWYIKNALVAGNPIYPLVFGGHEWNEISTRWLLVLGQEMSLLDLLAIPWTLTVLATQGSVAYDATFSPLFLTLLPLLLIVRRQAKGLGALLLASAVGFVLWIASGAAAYGTFVLQGRQILPIFAFLSLLCAYSLDGLRVWDRKVFSLQRFLKLLVALTLVLGLLGQILFTIHLDPWSYLAGAQSRADFQDRHTTQRLHQAISYINENLGPDDKVLQVWEPRSYGLDVPHEPDVLFDNFSQLLARYGSPAGIAAGLQQEGVTHLLVNQYIYPWIAEDYPLTPEEKKDWEVFQAQYLTKDTVVHTEGEFLVLYRLAGGESP